MGLCTLVVIERYDAIESILKTWGFDLSPDGMECLQAYVADAKKMMPPTVEEEEVLLFQLLILLAMPKDQINETEVNSWMPSPERLAEMQRTNAFLRCFGFHDIMGFIGARVYLKLGREDDAHEVARLAVLPEQKNTKLQTYIYSASIIGQIEARRGNLDESHAQFTVALEKSKLLTEMPMFELLAARDWKKHLLVPNGRDCSVAEVAIDAACAKMDKTREQLSSIIDA